MTSMEMGSIDLIKTNIKDALTQWNHNEILQKYPMLTLSYAQSIDGCIAAKQGASLALSGMETMKMTHAIRSMHQGILVGVNTVKIDDPSLTVRLTEGTSPTPIILDTKLTCPLKCKLLTDSSCLRPTIICAKITNPDIYQRKLVLEGLGASVLECETLQDPSTEHERVDVRRAFEMLRKLGYDSIMIEGGSGVITSCLIEAAHHAILSSVIITIAPTFVGGLHAVDQLLLNRAGQMLRLMTVKHYQVGNDMVLVGRFAIE